MLLLHPPVIITFSWTTTAIVTEKCMMVRTRLTLCDQQSFLRYDREYLRLWIRKPLYDIYVKHRSTKFEGVSVFWKSLYDTYLCPTWNNQICGCVVFWKLLYDTYLCITWIYKIRVCVSILEIIIWVVVVCKADFGFVFCVLSSLW